VGGRSARTVLIALACVYFVLDAFFALGMLAEGLDTFRLAVVGWFLMAATACAGAAVFLSVARPWAKTAFWCALAVGVLAFPALGLIVGVYVFIKVQGPEMKAYFASLRGQAPEGLRDPKAPRP